MRIGIPVCHPSSKVLAHFFFLLASILMTGLPRPLLAQLPFFDQLEKLRSSTLPKGFSRAAISGDDVYVTWMEQGGMQGGTNVWYTQSKDKGATFSQPRNLSGLHSPDSDNPRIAADGNNVFITWTDYVVMSGGISHAQTMLIVSADRGGSFSSPINLSNTNLCDAEYSDVAASDGKIYVTWEQLSCGDEGVFLASGGAVGPYTVKEVPFSRSSNGFFPKVAASEGVVHVLALVNSNDVSEASVIRSEDGGKTFLGEKGFGTPGARHVTSAIAASGTRVYVLWEEDAGNSQYRVGLATSRDKGVTYASSRTAKNYLGAGGPVDAAATGQGASAIWFGDNGDVWYWELHDDEAIDLLPTIIHRTGNSAAGAPSLAASDTLTFATWSESGTNWDIIAASLKDSDGDGIPDDWETNGVPVGNVRVQLPCTADPDTGNFLCPDPNHKDIFVEIDYLSGHKPHSGAIAKVERAFKAAPVKNPDNTNGIRLHVLVDEELPHEDAVLAFKELDEIKDAHLGSEAERNGPDAAEVKIAKMAIFHYVLFAHNFKVEAGGPALTNSGYAQMGGADLIVSLGSGFGKASVSIDGAVAAPHSIGTEAQQAATLMHELGHNLNLHHGGRDEVMFKPNYLSVMNYLFQFPVYVANRAMDFSREELDPVDENQFSEEQGFTINRGQALFNTNPSFGATTAWRNGYIARGTVGKPIDWNGNGIIEPGIFSGDINHVDTRDEADGLTVMQSHDDWSNLHFLFRASGIATGAAPVEVTAEDLLDAHRANLEALDYHIQILPPDAYDSATLAPLHLADLRSALMLAPNSVLAMVNLGDFGTAAAALWAIRSRMDGSASTDWITSTEAQSRLLPEVDNILLAFANSKDFGGGAPVANPGTDQIVEEGAAVTLNGSQSDDPDGGTLTFAWTQVGGPAVSLTGANTARASFVAPAVYADAVLTFQLIVSSGSRVSMPAFVNITVRKHVNKAPVAVLEGSRTVQPGAVVMLDGSASYDPEGLSLTYTWSQTTGPTATLTDAASSTPSFIAPNAADGTILTFQLTVNDGTLTSAAKTVSITIHLVESAPTVDPPVQVGDGVANAESSAGLAISGNSIYMVWLSGGLNFKASQDGGKTFDANMKLVGNVGYSTVGVWIAASGDHVYVLYIDSSTYGTAPLYLLTSNDRGRTFGTPVLIAPRAVGGFKANHILADGDTVYLTYGVGPWYPTPLNFLVSRDAGATFEAPITITTSVYENAYLLFDSGRVYVGWYDGYVNGCLSGWGPYSPESINVVASGDGGRTFTAPVTAVHKDVQHSGNTWCGISLAKITASGGSVRVWWLDADLNPALTPWALKLTTSTDGGVTFGAPRTMISDNNWQFSGFEGGSEGQMALISEDSSLMAWPHYFSTDSADMLDLWLQTSADDFASVRNLTSPAYSGYSNYDGGAIAKDPDATYILWRRNHYTTGSAEPYQYLLFSSFDDAANFSVPINIFPTDATGRYNVKLATRGKKFFAMVYPEANGYAPGVYFVRGGPAGDSTGSDTTPPIIVPNISPAPGASGWYNSDTTVTWTVSDPESGVSSSDCSPTVISADTAGTTVTCTAFNNDGGSASKSVVVRLDKTGPTITGDRVTPTPASGWNTTDVELVFSCSDALSGLANCGPNPLVVSSEGRAQTVTGTARDLAGNSASFAVRNINIDKTAPAITSHRVTLANSNGWNNSDVEVSFACTDDTSGVASCGPSPVVVSMEGRGQTVTGAAADVAGNTATSVVSNINVDKTAPTITGYRVTPANASGWNSTDVEISFSCADESSGVASCGPSPLVVSAEGAAQTATGTVRDLAENSASFTVSDINIDKTAPIVTAAVIPPPNGKGWNNTPVVVSFSGTDTGSTVAACDPVIAVAAEGANQPVTGSCTDKAGNKSAFISVAVNLDLTKPSVTPPAALSIPTTESSGARASTSSALATFLAGGTANDNLDASPARLSAQYGGTDVTSSTLFPIGSNVVTFLFQDAAGNIGTATAQVTVTGAAHFNLSTDKTSATIKRGGSATFVITTTPVNAFNAPVTFSCLSPLPKSMGCTFTPASVTPIGGKPASTTLTISTKGSATAKANESRLLVSFGMVWIIGLALRARGSKRRWGVLGVTLLALTMMFSACGGNGWTPSGSYTIQVNATSGSLVETVSLSLTVQ